MTIGQTIGQRKEQEQLIAEGYRRGEVDEAGDYWPLGIDPTDGKLKRLGSK